MDEWQPGSQVGLALVPIVGSLKGSWFERGCRCHTLIGWQAESQTSRTLESGWPV